MPDATWKKAERKIAELLGGERLGPAGTPQPDVVTPTIVAEVKHRKQLPQWLLDAVEQAREQRDIQRMPCAILHQKDKWYKHSLVVVRLDDFVEYTKRDGYDITTVMQEIIDRPGWSMSDNDVSVDDLSSM